MVVSEMWKSESHKECGDVAAVSRGVLMWRLEIGQIGAVMIHVYTKDVGLRYISQIDQHPFSFF